MKTRVDVEFVRELKAEIGRINRLKFENIKWYKKGKKIKITKKLKQLSKQFPYCGLSNKDFVDWIK